MPCRLEDGISGRQQEMVQAVSRFAMSEHADLTSGTKEGCLGGGSMPSAASAGDSTNRPIASTAQPAGKTSAV